LSEFNSTSARGRALLQNSRGEASEKERGGGRRRSRRSELKDVEHHNRERKPLRKFAGAEHTAFTALGLLIQEGA